MLLCSVERAGRGAADRHAETLVLLASARWFIYEADLWECSDLLVSIAVEVLLCVVDGHAAVDAVWQSSVLHDWDAFV